jgi:arginase
MSHEITFVVYKKNMLKFIIQKSEIGAGTRGSSLGPDAVLLAGTKHEANLFDGRTLNVLENRNDQLFHPTDTERAIRIKPMLEVWENHAKGVSEGLENGDVPIVISADHASAGATIAGIKMANPDKRLGVIWIDAHADLHSPYTSPSGNIHGMPLACSIGDDNNDFGRELPSDETISAWEGMKTLGNISPKIDPSDIRFVAVRETEKEEDHLMKKHSIQNYSVSEARRMSMKTVGLEVLAGLQNCDLIYVSFDVDSMDPDIVSYGTGTPVKDGLTPEEASELINVLLTEPKLCCFEMVEVNPLLDNKCNVMGETAYEILASAIETLESK